MKQRPRINNKITFFSTGLALVASMSAAAFAVSAPAKPITRYVDDTCLTPTTGTQADPYCTISEAVTAANAGDTIIVAPGTYPETVTVSKSLKLQGAQIGKPADTRVTTTAQESVVGAAGGGFAVSANDVTIDGFTVSDATGAPGITTAAAQSGYKIINNIIKNNVFGLYLNSAGAKETSVSRNLFATNNTAGSAAGNGIYSDQKLERATIDRNKFTGNVNASITFAHAPDLLNDVTVTRNTAVGERTFTNIYAGDNIEVSRNELNAFAPEGSAIFFAGGANEVLVERNVIRNAGYSGIRFRGENGINSNVSITRNDVQTVGDFGIGLAGNAVNDGSISRNITRLSTNDGIRIDAGNTDLTLERNESTGNTVFDIIDANAAQNDYNRNICVKDSPATLCQ